jgi:bifunctional non-homologous end joining protein LigD
MLATPAPLPADPPSGEPEWTYEPKWDGMRVIARCDGTSTLLASRRGRDATGSFPELAGLADALGVAAVLDGEVVAPNPDGQPDFQRLQERMHRAHASPDLQRRVPVTYVVFDVLWLAGQPTLELPWSQRRRLLDELEVAGPRWATCPTYPGEGDVTMAAAQAQGLEGVVAKRMDSPYLPGQRSRSWIKVKLLQTAELLVGGWVPGEGGRSGGVGSLLVGGHDADGELVWVGSVGSGLTSADLDWYARNLVPRDTSPFANQVVRPDVRFAEPEVVVDVRFREVTAEGLLRQPVYRGRRTDVAPDDVMLPDGHPAMSAVR